MASIIELAVTSPHFIPFSVLPNGEVSSFTFLTAT